MRIGDQIMGKYFDLLSLVLMICRLEGFLTHFFIS